MWFHTSYLLGFESLSQNTERTSRTSVPLFAIYIPRSPEIQKLRDFSLLNTAEHSFNIGSLTIGKTGSRRKIKTSKLQGNLTSWSWEALRKLTLSTKSHWNESGCQTDVFFNQTLLVNTETAEGKKRCGLECCYLALGRLCKLNKQKYNFISFHPSPHVQGLFALHSSSEDVCSQLCEAASVC